MNYVCKSLSWWRTGVLVLELKLEPSLPERVEYSQRGTTVHPPGSLTVPIPVDVQMLTELPASDVFPLFMLRLTPLLTQLGTGLRHREQISTALTSLAASVRNSSSMRGYPLCFMQLITE